MLLITINEIIDEFGYNCREVSDMLKINYNHVLNLKNIKCKYTKNDINKINTWMNNRGKNVLHIDFNIKKNNNKIYKFQQRGIVELNEYRRSKKQEQRRIEREIMQSERNAYFQRLFDTNK